MTDLPERHPAVPPSAHWRSDLDKWETPSHDGERLLHRSDGTLYQRSLVKAGTEEGPFTVYHPSGAVARQGQHAGGELDGEIVSHVDPSASPGTGNDPAGQGGDVIDEGHVHGESDPGAASPDSVPLRACCVPQPAVQMRALYVRGKLQFERFFDDAGRLLLSDGRLCPDRPATLPAAATFHEGSDRWVVAPAPGAADDLHRYYRGDGSLDEETRFHEGGRTFIRRYAAGVDPADPAAASPAVLEAHMLIDGRRQGPWYCRYATVSSPGSESSSASPYLDARIAAEIGSFVADVPAGTWTFHDEHGAAIRTVHFGEPPFVPPADPVFADEAREAAAWQSDADTHLAEGRLAHALCAAARAAARSGEPTDLLSMLAKHTVALAREPAAALAKAAAAATDEPLVAVLAALLAGADPAEALRALSSLLRPSPRASLDFAEAALLLAPDHPACRFSRALARLELGEDGGALADARLLDTAAPEFAQFLRDYIRVMFPTWEFWPAQERWGDPVEGVPDEPGQPLPEIRRAMQIYATRLAILREALVARAPRRARAPWMPPATPDLLPEGPIELRRFETTITDETEEGSETVAVFIDETLDPGGLGVTGLLLHARRQWAALTWLAWAVGLNRLALPTAISAPATFTAGAAAALTRYFRVTDTLQTGGLRSRTAGAPSFSFGGVDVDQLPPTIAEVVRQETHELRALFLWLLSPENHSPFQNDLRED